MSHDVLESVVSQEPTFEELRAALPAELQLEYDELWRWKLSLPLACQDDTPKDFVMKGFLLYSDEERFARLRRFDELDALARKNHKEIVVWKRQQSTAASKWLMQRIQEALANLR